MKLYFGLAGFAAGTLGFIAYQAAHQPRPSVTPEPRAPSHATAPTAPGPTYVIMPTTGTAPTATLATAPPPKKKHHRKKTDAAQPPADEPAEEPVAEAKPTKPILRLSTAATGPAETADPAPSTMDPTMKDLLEDNTPSLSGRTSKPEGRKAK